MNRLLSDRMLYNGKTIWESITLADMSIPKLDMEIDAARQYINRLMITRYDLVGKQSRYRKNLTPGDPCVENE